MKFKIQAGAEIDVATRDEVRQEIAAVRSSWMAEVAKGDRFVSFSGFADITAGEVLIGATGEAIGPQPGFVWSVTRLALTNYDPTTDAVAIYRGDVSDSATVIPLMDRRHELFSGNELVLYPGDTLQAAGSVTGSGRVWLTGQARELPVSLAWRL